MKLFQNKKFMFFLRILPFLACIALIAGYYAAGNEFSAEAILSYTPDDPAAAAAVLLVLFAMKSLSIIFPVMALFIASGTVFGTYSALVINFAGMAVCMSVSYWFGRFSGREFIKSLTDGHPKLAAIVKWQESNDFFLCFFLRAVNSLPLDIVSMYFGAVKMPFLKYLISGLIGAAPGVAAATVLGGSISDPTSPAFIFSVVLTILIAAVSAAAYSVYKKKHHA